MTIRTVFAAGGEPSAALGRHPCAWCGKLHPGKASIFCSARCSNRAAWPWRFEDTRRAEPFIIRLCRSASQKDALATVHASKPVSESFCEMPHPLNEKWRVSDDGTQWILERRAGARWNGFSWCRTRFALERCIRERVGLDIGLALPLVHPSLTDGGAA